MDHSSIICLAKRGTFAAQLPNLGRTLVGEWFTPTGAVPERCFPSIQRLGFQTPYS